MLPESSVHYFDRDLEMILDRVYRSRSDTRPVIEMDAVTMRELLIRRERGSQELKQALAELRDRRERSQSVLRLKEEVDYLQEQIEQLKLLGEQIAALRKKLAEDGEPLTAPQGTPTAP